MSLVGVFPFCTNDVKYKKIHRLLQQPNEASFELTACTQLIPIQIWLSCTSPVIEEVRTVRDHRVLPFSSPSSYRGAGLITSKLASDTFSGNHLAYSTPFTDSNGCRKNDLQYTNRILEEKWCKIIFWNATNLYFVVLYENADQKSDKSYTVVQTSTSGKYTWTTSSCLNLDLPHRTRQCWCQSRSKLMRRNMSLESRGGRFLILLMPFLSTHAPC